MPNQGVGCSLLVALTAALGACSETGRADRSPSDATTDHSGSPPATHRDSGHEAPGSGGKIQGAGSGGSRSKPDAAKPDSTDAALGAGGGSNAGGGASSRDGSAEAGAAPDSGRPVSAGTNAVLERNNHPTRDGAFVQPALTIAAAARMAVDSGFNATFSGSMWASPLYWESADGADGRFFAVTTDNDVIAFDETTGVPIWKTNIGPSPTENGVPCGGIHPLGIISTPVIDGTSGTIYVSGAIGTTSISRHEVHAFSVFDGTERRGFPVVVSAQSGGTTFTPAPQNQRSALSLVNGVLYVAFGGHSGDCGPYHGWVIGIDTKNPSKTGGWATLGVGEGIWAAGGMASDGNGVFAITGNGSLKLVDHVNSDSEEVVRITGLGVLERSSQNLYFPTTWHDMDMRDSDFGANSPIYLAVPGSTPSHVLVAISKTGQLYLLDPNNLGGMGGHLVTIPVAGGASSIHTVPAAYTTPAGVHVVLSDNSAGLCPPPRGKDSTVLSLVVQPGAPPKPVITWCAPLAGLMPGPMPTTTDGVSNAMVWYMNNGKLNAVDGDTGKPIFDGGTFTCSGVRQYTSPIAVKGRIVIGGDGHLCSWSVH